VIIALVIVWALVLGFSPGLALIGGALTLLIVDGLHPTLIDRLVGREAG
jgi:hypothetical protein